MYFLCGFITLIWKKKDKMYQFDSSNETRTSGKQIGTLSKRHNTDFEPIKLDELESIWINNNGNFRALLSMRCRSCDEILRNHIFTAPIKKCNGITNHTK